MNTIGLHPVYKPRDPSRRYKGIAIVVALHIIIFYGVISGTAHNVLVAMKKPLEAVVIQEVIIPPPPPPPPPPTKKIETPKDIPKEAPPPFVPVAEVAPPIAAPAISAVAAPPPTPVVIAPPPPPPPVVAAPTRTTTSIALACPTQVAPEMPAKALQDGIDGVVKAQATIKDGVVQNVTILSGPRVFHAAVRNAMMKYKCVSGTGEVVATQEFNFKID